MENTLTNLRDELRKSRRKQGDPCALWVVGEFLRRFIISWLVLKEFGKRTVLGDYGMQSMCVCSNQGKCLPSRKMPLVLLQVNLFF
jgi:hypothetical protein